MRMDKYGRTWDDEIERCPTCGQPDNSGDCNHEVITAEQVILLGGTPTPKERA